MYTLVRGKMCKTISFFFYFFFTLSHILGESIVTTQWTFQLVYKYYLHVCVCAYLYCRINEVYGVFFFFLRNLVCYDVPRGLSIKHLASIQRNSRTNTLSIHSKCRNHWRSTGTRTFLLKVKNRKLQTSKHTHRLL